MLRITSPIARWSLNFVHDQFACGRRFRILNVVDDVTQECLAAIPDTSISGRRVAHELTALIEQRGKPGMIVSDNGTEFTSNAMLAWAEAHNIYLALHRTGQTHAERLLREFQRPDAGRATQREPVLRPRSCPDKDRGLGKRLKPGAAALGAVPS